MARRRVADLGTDDRIWAMKTETWFQYLMAALMSLGLYILTDIKTELTTVTELLTNHRINHPKEDLSDRVVILEQQLKATRRSER